MFTFAGKTIPVPVGLNFKTPQLTHTTDKALKIAALKTKTNDPAQKASFPLHPLNVTHAKGIRNKISGFILYFPQNYQTYRLLTELQRRGEQQPQLYSIGKESQKMVIQLFKYVKVQDILQSATPQVQPELLVLDYRLLTLSSRHRITNTPSEVCH